MEGAAHVCLSVRLASLFLGQSLQSGSLISLFYEGPAWDLVKCRIHNHPPAEKHSNLKVITVGAANVELCRLCTAQGCLVEGEGGDGV